MNRTGAVRKAWLELITALGYDPADPHLADSPARVAKFLSSWHSNKAHPPKLTTFPKNPGYNEMVVVSDIRYHSMCAHHGLPFFGTAAVAYIPGKRIVGLSKLARVVDHYCRRFQTQEQITQDVANFLQEKLDPVGVGVVLSGEHLCMSMRGIERPGHVTKTSALLGALFNNPAARAEFFSHIGLARHL